MKLRPFNKILKIAKIYSLFTLLSMFSIYTLNAGARPVYNESANFVANKSSADVPYVTIGVHRVGRLGLTTVNKGQIGTAQVGTVTDPRDPSIFAPSCTYPYPGQNTYLFGAALWVGAIVGNDTLVSVGADGWINVQELWPDPYPKGDVIFQTTDNPEDITAVAEEEFSMIYTDTVTNPAYVMQDGTDGRQHIPLNIEITQNSYAWSSSNDSSTTHSMPKFVIFEYSIKNIGSQLLEDAFIGINVDGDVGRMGDGNYAIDDIAGFRTTVDRPLSQFVNTCGWQDTVNIAWISDNNGLNDSNVEDQCPFGSNSPIAVTGVRILKKPADSAITNFNWWVSNGNPALDFGPRLEGTEEDPFRDFGGYLGTPSGDRNKYYIMSHQEQDYDQLFTALDHTSEGWLSSPYYRNDLSNGFDTRFLLSCGPVDIFPGESVPFAFAYVAGDNFLTDCDAYAEFDPENPDEYYNTLDFSDFAKNSMAASWTFDIPGFDTNGDGYRGEQIICKDSFYINDQWVITRVDTQYYCGDGVPDLSYKDITDIYEEGHADNSAPLSGFKLLQNHPNPFNAATVIEYELPRKSIVAIEIYDILGRKIVTLIDQLKSAGRHNVLWDGKNSNNQSVSSGVYFYSIRAGEYSVSKKMVLLR